MQHNSDQIASLIALLQNQQSNLSSERLSGKTMLFDVIIDTRASHHMTGDLSLLYDVHDIPSSSVACPNGQDSNATKQGTLRLSKDYMLTDVLFVHDFLCTLISVSKLLKQTGCIAIFTDTLCVLHDHFSRTLIGAGEEREGVYYFWVLKLHEFMELQNRKLLLQLCGIVDLGIHPTRLYLPYLFFRILK